MKVRVKICGIRREEDLEAAVALGVELIGFNFWAKSKRFIDVGPAARLVQRLPPSVQAVGVFVNSPVEEVGRVAREVGLHAVQLHGDERPADYVSLPVEVIQVVRVRDLANLPDGIGHERIQRVLLDAAVEGYGGAGTRFDWSLVDEARRRFERDLLLAGGLTPENVGEAIRAARPWGVDVASGVESAPGVKSLEKLKAFVAAVRAVEREG